VKDDFTKELRETLKEAHDCIVDLGSGKDGWAWEEVCDRIIRAMDALQDAATKSTS
jgi:hypothetical protein